MNDLELEPLPDDVLAALGEAPVPALPPGVAEAVLAKVKVSAGLSAAAVVSNAASQGVSSTTVADPAALPVLVPAWGGRQALAARPSSTGHRCLADAGHGGRGGDTSGRRSWRDIGGTVAQRARGRQDDLARGATASLGIE